MTCHIVAGMATIEQLMHANLLEVFNERDDERRRAAMTRTYAPDVRFTDPDEVVVGHEAVDTKAQKILDEAPGFVFSPAGPTRVIGDLGYLEWNFGPEGQRPVVRGADIALAADGLITSIYTLLFTD
jgi:SnoaL-like protein